VQERKAMAEYEELPVDTYNGHTRAFLKIQDGCDQFCSYCIIPYARGPVRSRGMSDILREARNFADRGFKEVVLTGIHLTSFGDEKSGTGLADLIREIHKIDGVERIRLGSLEPMFLTSDFIKGIKDLNKLCPHFHISLQSGSEKTLKRMNRKYRPEDYRRIVKELREQIPDVTFTTDVMVGFPGETDEEFMESYDFCKEMEFLWIHVFKYSPRKGTPAACYENQIDPKIKDARSKSLIELAESMRHRIFEGFLGREMSMIPEKTISAEELEGLTSNYITVSVGLEDGIIGEIIDIRLTGIENDHIRGIKI
jgi:threonylcarbamoyladenosine tRNA methylthiotransferase MtaB